MRLVISVSVVISMVTCSAWAQNGDTGVTTMDEMVVVGEKIVTPTKQANEQVYTGTEITGSGMELPGVKADVSVYEAMDLLPGVQVESVDPFGLAAEQKNTRVRGVRGYLGSMTVEGIPSWGGNPMGPREYIYDMKNFESIAVYKGAIPAALGTGVGARGGAVELRPKWPDAEKRGIDIDTNLGSNRYSRIFSRIDTGRIGEAGTALSLSASYTDADKWKGPGDLGPRFNTNFMVSQPYHGDDVIRLWVNHNEVEQHLYKTLTFAETRSLRDNYSSDFNDRLTGVRATDINYYDNNRAKHDNTDLLAVIPFTFNDVFKAAIKPYYSKEDADIFQGVASQGGMVQKRIRDIERYGVLSQVDMNFAPVRLSVGHLFESSDMVINTEMYNPITGAFGGYGIRTENDDSGYLNSPFVSLAGSVGAMDWQAGLKYFRYREPASQGYRSV
ncbi:MAG: TonB-dependent receptor plug domain-containing protein, partial [Desulfobulbus sp.]|nr:TonB-dependent receptor plug domain-containing protein [Desulfobulbus sp.]